SFHDQTVTRRDNHRLLNVSAIVLNLIEANAAQVNIRLNADTADLDQLARFDGLAQREPVSRVTEYLQCREAVSAVRRGCQAKRESRTEVAEQPLVRFGCRVVGFIDDQVSEVLWRESLQIPCQALNRTDNVVLLGLVFFIEEKARRNVGPEFEELVPRLKHEV